MSVLPSKLPRVLIISTHVFNPYTGGGIALTNYFKGWPKDKIAEIYSDNIPADPSVCNRFYELGPSEIKWQWPLSMAYHRHFNQRATAAHAAVKAAKSSPANDTSPLKFIFDAGMNALGGKALFYRIELSPALEQWIRDFKPDLIFTQLGNLPIMDLLDRISEKFDLPISLQIPDNWLESDFRRGLFSAPLRRRMQEVTARIIKKAALRYGISDMMCEAYEKKFGVPFLSLLNPVDLHVWRTAARISKKVKPPLTILYSGTIVVNSQLGSLRTIKRAVLKRNALGKPTQLKIFTPRMDLTRYRPEMEERPAVQMDASPPSKELPKLFASADVLLVPVNFDAESLRYIRYSVPGKIPAYMSSGTPILIFGPAEVASVDYALKKKWAYVVPTNSEQELLKAFDRLESDDKLRAQISKNALAVVRHEHDAAEVRKKMWDALTKASRS